MISKAESLKDFSQFQLKGNNSTIIEKKKQLIPKVKKI